MVTLSKCQEGEGRVLTNDVWWILKQRKNGLRSTARGDDEILPIEVSTVARWGPSLSVSW